MVGLLHTAHSAAAEWGQTLATTQEPPQQKLHGGYYKLYNKYIFKPQDPGGMSTYRVLLSILRRRQYLIGGRAAIEVIAFTKRHVSKETLLVLRNKISASGWYSSGNPVVPP